MPSAVAPTGLPPLPQARPGSGSDRAEGDQRPPSRSAPGARSGRSGTRISTTPRSSWAEASAREGPRQDVLDRKVRGKLPAPATPTLRSTRAVYLQLALDQAYHPDGFYTYPSTRLCATDPPPLGSASRHRIHARSTRRSSLGGPPGPPGHGRCPQQLGEPSEEMRLRRGAPWHDPARLPRSFPHLQRTWGLMTRKEYLPATQEWVGSIPAREGLDPTHLVRTASQSRPRGTDIKRGTSTWRPRGASTSIRWFGTRPRLEVELMSAGETRARAALRECGNVWGYGEHATSTGPEYHIMLNEFRRHPRSAAGSTPSTTM
jgi:hypothetical protein